MRICVFTFGLTIVSTVLLYLYACQVGYFLYGHSGGIYTHGKWTQYGGAPYAWTIPIQLPGGIIMAFGNRIYGNQSQNWLTSLGALITLGGLIATSYTFSSVLMAYLTQKPSIFGRYKWKVVLIILGLVWIPVPETMAWVYQITVVY